MADACLYVGLQTDSTAMVNIGAGTDVTIRELAERIVEVVGYTGEIIFDPSQPDGTPQKLLDVSRLAELGWRARINLDAGLRMMYDWYRSLPPTGREAFSDNREKSFHPFQGRLPPG
jgi:GDP-L-fucose synthase